MVSQLFSNEFKLSDSWVGFISVVKLPLYLHTISFSSSPSFLTPFLPPNAMQCKRLSTVYFFFFLHNHRRRCCLSSPLSSVKVTYSLQIHCRLQLCAIQLLYYIHQSVHFAHIIIVKGLKNEVRHV